MNDKAAQGRAALACRPDRREENCPRCKIEIGRRSNDHGVVPAQFQKAVAKPFGHARGDCAAHPCASRGAEQGDARVIDKLFARFARADDDVQKARRRFAEFADGGFEQVFDR